jgi:subtilisin family serine protease
MVALRPLPEATRFDWGGRIMRFDQIPEEYRGDGVKVALIDSGVATSHDQLAAIELGFAVSGDDEESWSQDPIGHGTACAGLIAAADAAECIGGYAMDAQLQICKLPLEAYCSDLVAAFDYCVRANVDLACVGFGCRQGSVIVEQRLAELKRLGIAVIAAAGSNADAVQFPACSRQVLAVGAVGRPEAFRRKRPRLCTRFPRNACAAACSCRRFPVADRRSTCARPGLR